MIATLALALSLPPLHVPADAELVYPVMPQLTPIANEDGEKVALRMSIHSARARLGETTCDFASLSLFKNTTDFSGEVELAVSFESYRHGFGAQIPVRALWSDVEVEPAEVEVLTGEPSRYVVKFRVPVDKAATHSLRLYFTLPIGVSGVDREERLIAYKLADIGQSEAIEQFRMSVQYDQRTVFVPIAAKPDLGWEVGPRGAYLKMDGRRSDHAEVLSYRYYPAGFRPIGWQG
ncbi:MAG: hypothetical protein IH945_02250 [Armatimonadetes bacterium]|nr:hypothetical protein [Armatimonadota bacterium]